MIFADDGVIVKEDATVEVTASEYAKLVQIADRYHTIIELVFKGAYLKWNNQVELNSDDVLTYIGFVEQRRTEAERDKLLAEKKKQEAAK